MARTSPGASPRKFAVVGQRHANDCGPAALATVLASYGRSVEDEDIRGAAPVARGTDLLQLSRLADRLGFESVGVRGSYDAISICTLPAIAPLHRRITGGHFVVIHRWTAGHVVVADPAGGIRRVSRRSFARLWTGYLLVVRPRCGAGSTTSIDPADEMANDGTKVGNTVTLVPEFASEADRRRGRSACRERPRCQLLAVSDARSSADVADLAR